MSAAELGKPNGKLKSHGKLLLRRPRKWFTALGSPVCRECFGKLGKPASSVSSPVRHTHIVCGGEQRGGEQRAGKLKTNTGSELLHGGAAIVPNTRSFLQASETK
jgi:hypothetical protein